MSSLKYVLFFFFVKKATRFRKLNIDLKSLSSKFGHSSGFVAFLKVRLTEIPGV